MSEQTIFKVIDKEKIKREEAIKNYKMREGNY